MVFYEYICVMLASCTPFPKIITPLIPCLLGLTALYLISFWTSPSTAIHPSIHPSIHLCIYASTMLTVFTTPCSSVQNDS